MIGNPTESLSSVFYPPRPDKIMRGPEFTRKGKEIHIKGNHVKMIVAN